MTAFGIVMVVLFCLIVPAICVLLALYTRSVFVLSKKSTPQNFVLKAPVWYAWLAFLGFLAAFFVLVALSTFWQTSAGAAVYCIFAIFAVIFAGTIFAQYRTKLEFNGDTIIKTTLFTKKVIKRSNLTAQKPINNASSIVVYMGDKRAFIISELMSGYQFVEEYLRDVPPYNFAPKPKTSYIKDSNE